MPCAFMKSTYIIYISCEEIFAIHKAKGGSRLTVHRYRVLPCLQCLITVEVDNIFAKSNGDAQLVKPVHIWVLHWKNTRMKCHLFFKFHPFNNNVFVWNLFYINVLLHFTNIGDPYRIQIINCLSQKSINISTIQIDFSNTSLKYKYK